MTLIRLIHPLIRVRLFFYLRFVFEIFQFNQNPTPFFKCVTTKVYLSLVEKTLPTDLGPAEFQTGQIFDRFFRGDKLISEYFKRNF